MIKKTTIYKLLCSSLPVLMFGLGATFHLYFENAPSITFYRDCRIKMDSIGQSNTLEDSPIITHSDFKHKVAFDTKKVVIKQYIQKIETS